MGIRHNVKQGLKKYKITKIDEQPTDEDLNLLTKELTNAAGSVANLKWRQRAWPRWYGY
jgi:hypothetical protein